MIRSATVVLLLATAVPFTAAIECYQGLKLIAGQTVGDQIIRCENSGAQCYNMTVAAGSGSVIDIMKAGCSLWRCIATRDKCVSTTFQKIPISFCCCSTPRCNAGPMENMPATQIKSGGWNAVAPSEGTATNEEESVVRKHLGETESMPQAAANMTLSDYLETFDDHWMNGNHTWGTQEKK